MKLTDEQHAIVEAFRQDDGDLVADALAGTGKTSTLRMAAEAVPNQRGLYIAYNKAIAAEASRAFPSSVQCRTSHSLAFHALGYRYKHRLHRPRITAFETAAILSLPKRTVTFGDVQLTQTDVARLVVRTIERFVHSADQQVRAKHVPHVNGLSKDGHGHLAGVIAVIARWAWDSDLSRTDGRMRFTHDHYLKLWALSNPQLLFDYVMLDEAQDTNGCVAGIVLDSEKNSGFRRIMVGDRNQAIYGWRGAFNAMDEMPGDRLQLTQSFRFGDAIADQANIWLAMLGSLRLRGFNEIPSRIGDLPFVETDAILCRTNAGTVRAAMAAMDAGQRVALVGGGQDIRRMAIAAGQLLAGQRCDHPELFTFETWNDVRTFVEEDESAGDLAVFVRLVDKLGPEEILRVMDGLVDERRADVIVSTAHKAKGREWGRVLIGGDFTGPGMKDGKQVPPAAGELMLAYVATTRARHVLDPGGLSWVNEWLGR